MHTAKRGQGTIEYLVIIAVVIVLALAASFFMFSGLGSASQADKASVKAEWLTKEVGVGDFAVDDEGTGKIAILNNSGEQVKLKQIYIDDVLVYDSSRNMANFDSYVAGPFTDLLPCNPDKKYKLKIVYESDSGLEKFTEGYLYVECAARMLERGLRFIQLTDANLSLGDTINVSAATGYFTLTDANFVNSRSITYGNAGFGDYNGVDLNTTRNTDNNYIELDVQAE
jgi:hypothetical protein